MATLQVTNLQNTASTVTNVSLLADGTTTLVLNSTGTARTGGIRYVGGVLEVYNGGSWVAVTPPVAATSAQAAAGTLTTVYSSPATAVPKDASGMTGAAILPSGTNLQRAAIATPVAGMTRFNTDYTPDSLEVYNGTRWNQLAYVPDLGTLPDLNITANQVLPSAGTYENITIAAGVTATVQGVSFLRARTSITVLGTIQASGAGYPGINIGAGSPAAGQTSITSFSGNGPGGQGLSTSFSPVFMGSGGGAGNVVAVPAQSAGVTGGSGGGGIVLVCDGPITIGSSASLLANGGPAIANFGAASGPGGGSGGCILLQSNTSLTLQAGAILSANGGPGGNATLNNSWGGGGGGGGYIILNSPNTTDASTRTVTGGAAGSSLLAPTVGINRGGTGAGYGGSGGDNGAFAASSTGAPGLILTNAYI